jgi:hypothetical protein
VASITNSASRKRSARPRFGTLDGGRPSNAKIALQIEVFPPLQAVLGGDELYLSAIGEMLGRLHRRPTPVCGACDYEFAPGEFPPLLFATRPFIPKVSNHAFIAGVICPHCADLPIEVLMAALIEHLRLVKPDITILQGGQA